MFDRLLNARTLIVVAMQVVGPHADLPLALLRQSMYERSVIDQTFTAAGKSVVPKIESESILHLMFQTQFTELCTVIPSHYTRMPGQAFWCSVMG